MTELPGLKFKGPLTHPVLGIDVLAMVQRSFDLLLENEFCGIDPGSYYSQNLRRFHSKGHSLINRAWNKGFHTLVALGGAYSTKAFALPNITSTKAAALTLSGLASLKDKPEICDPSELETTAKALIDWLVDRRNDDVGAWTPDFQYEIRGAAIPADVLGTINTVFCCEALWQWRDKFEAVDELIVTAAKACLRYLPRHETDTECCFSYNPSTLYFVHNANLFVALLLARASFLEPCLFSESAIVEKCTRYTLNDFDKAGALRYAGPPTVNNTVDNYHTGFVIRAMNELSPFIKDSVLAARMKRKINDGVKDYYDMFIKYHGVPKFSSSAHQIQAHSVAEALFLFSEFSELLEVQDQDRFALSMRKSVEVLWNSQSQSFDSEARVIGGFCFWRNTSPMPRWAWAWLFGALLTSL